MLQFHKLHDKPGNANQLLNFLADTQSPRFPELVKMRHVFSFLNGVYQADLDTFHFFEEEALSSNIVSAKMFEIRMLCAQPGLRALQFVMLGGSQW